MATWIKSNLGDNSYFQIGTIAQAKIDTPFNDGVFYICVASQVATGQFIPVKGPYTTRALAQTDLDNAIVSLGGSI
jgi:hypothetical protein